MTPDSPGTLWHVLLAILALLWLMWLFLPSHQPMIAIVCAVWLLGIAWLLGRER